MNDESGHNVWRSYSDMMSGLLLLFVLIMAVCLMQAQKNYNDKLAEQATRLQTQDALEQTQVELNQRESEIEAQSLTLTDLQTALEAQAAQLKSQEDELEAAKQQLLQQESELAARNEELTSRDAALAAKDAELAARTSCSRPARRSWTTGTSSLPQARSC
jgi:chemotaxis protein MotB